MVEANALVPLRALTHSWRWVLKVREKSIRLGVLGHVCDDVNQLRQAVASCDECLPCENTASPILLSFGDQRLDLTDLEGGVRFDLDADGEAERVAWTAAGAEDGFLVLDRDGDGRISSGAELFGDRTPQWPSDQRNGFAALALFDLPANGGDGDGRITPSDAIFASLSVWTDRNHDGRSAADELASLDEVAIEAVELDYHEVARTDRHGNRYRFLGKVRRIGGGTSPAWDVFFRTR